MKTITLKKLFAFIIMMMFSFSLTQSAMAQVRDHRKGQKTVIKPTTTPVTIYTEATLLAAPEVVLFENANYDAQFKVLGVGLHLLTDFNDVTSSIKIPNGLVAVIYEQANEAGGYGNYIDLMEDCPDLSTYSFADKTSYVNVFSATRPGYVWVRNRNTNNQFMAGHWEREKANGAKPDNSLPAVASSLSQTGTPDDFTFAPLASQAEIDEFNDIRTNQMNVAVLGGETTKPFYYHHEQEGEDVYKYNKVIDPARLPGKFYDWLGEQLGWAGVLVKPLAVIEDLSLDIKDFIFGSGSSKTKIDCWYPVSEFKTTVCGTMHGDPFICPQDYIHTQVTVDKDVCLEIIPSDKFKPMLSNRWILTTEVIEGEVKLKNKSNLEPLNPLLMLIKKDENVCLYGPWMADILDINAKSPIPFTDSKIELANIFLRSNNEIHPVNQLWRKIGNETHLVATVDETGYFKRTGNNEVAASGLNQRMRFYIAFGFPPKLNAMTAPTLVYDINGVGFDFTDIPASDVLPETITLKYKGLVRVQVNDNANVRNQKTHRVFFDKVRTRANGAVLGYIVIETEPISKEGGSINIFVKDVTPNNSPVGPITAPVKVRQ